MSTRTHDNFNLGKKVLLDARLAPVADYASLPDPNLPSNYIPEGGVILVQDTNHNWQAQIDPLNLPDLMWVDITSAALPGIGVSFIDITYSALSILRGANDLEKGAFYNITDRADAGIVLHAVDINRLSLHGTAAYFVADYAKVGNYLSTPLAVGTLQGVWESGLEAGMSNGDVVIWNGKHYQVQSTGSFAGTNPFLNTLAYALLTDSERRGYFVEVDFVKYDFLNDTILERSDRRGNIVNGNGISLFQWGNNNVYNNLIQNSAIYDCINNLGEIYGNVLSNTVIVVSDNTNLGVVRNSVFNNTGYSYTCNNPSAGQVLLDHCDVSLDQDIVFLSTEQYAGQICSNFLSTFSADLDMSIHFDFVDTLTIPTNLNYIANFKLTNTPGMNIVSILNLPFFKCRFKIENGGTQNFFHTPIAGAFTGNLVSDAAVTNLITGRTLSDDFIEYEPTGIALGTPVCRRTNIVILA